MHTLSQMSAHALDALPFGVVRMDEEGRVVAYSREEAALSGLSPGWVIGRVFFSAVAPCANTPGIAGRFAAEEVDVTVDYVFAFRSRPVPVRLRLLQAPGCGRFLLVARRR